MRHGESRRACVERREPIVLPAEHRSAGRLEELQRPGQVEKGLGAGRHRDHRMRCDRVQVGRDVAGQLAPAVHAADAPGGEHPHTGSCGDRHRGRHRGGTDVPTLTDGHRDVRALQPCGRAPGCVRVRRRSVRVAPRRRALPSPPGPRLRLAPPACNVRAPHDCVATAARGARRSSTRAPRPAAPDRSRHRTSSEQTGVNTPPGYDVSSLTGTSADERKSAMRSVRSSRSVGTEARPTQKVPTKAPSGLPLLITPGYCSIVIASASTEPSMVKVSISGFGPKMPSEITSPPSTTPQSW